MMENKKMVVAAFDFDCTISSRDLFLPFLIETFGWIKTFSLLFLESPYLLGFVLSLFSRQHVKERVLTRFFKGMNINDIKHFGAKFSKNTLPKFLKPVALERVQWHLQQGHRLVLISASVDIYLKPWTEQSGFDALLASSLEIDRDKKITGKLEGLNCWGEEKVRRLEALYGPKERYILYAYGDSRGDRELLTLADFSYYRTFK